MKIFLFLFGFFAFSIAQNLKIETIQFEIPENVESFIAKSNALKERRRNPRIQNGDDVTSDSELPFVVEITVSMAGSMFTCSGSIININAVLSSRECVRNPQTNVGATSIVAQAGSSSQVGFRFTTWSNFASYVSTGSTGNDPNFAVLRMGVDFPITETVRIVQLPTATQAGLLFENTAASFAGWGTTGTGASFTLQQSTGVIPTRFECTSAFVPSLTSYQLCLRSDNPQVTLDSGDRGGPVLFIEVNGTPTLIGVLERTVNTVNLPDPTTNLFFRVGIFWNFIHDAANVTRRF